jgi:hypothetical protein
MSRTIVDGQKAAPDQLLRFEEFVLFRQFDPPAIHTTTITTTITTIITTTLLALLLCRLLLLLDFSRVLNDE